MRSVTQEIETVLNSKGYSSFWLVDIHLPAQGDLPSHDFYVADSAVRAFGRQYRPLMRVQKPRMMQTLGRAPDGGSITVDNIEGTIGQAVLARGREFEGAKFVLWKAFLLPAGQLGIDKWMEGDIRSASIAESDQTITFQLNSDLLKRQSIMGAWMLSQRCIVPFNKNGVLSATESRCGWQMAQGGDPDSCDKTEDGENGCRAHGNLHRIVAVPAITASSNVTTLPGGMGGGGTGFPPDGPPACFLGGTPVLLPEENSCSIEFIKVGDMVLAPIRNRGTGEDMVIGCFVTDVMESTADEWYEVGFVHGKIEVTARHPFYTGSGTFRPIADLEIGDTVRAYNTGTSNFYDCPILSKTKRTGRVRVYNLTVEDGHTYFANSVAVHNEKWEYPQFPSMM